MSEVKTNEICVSVDVGGYQHALAIGLSTGPEFKMEVHHDVP